MAWPRPGWNWGLKEVRVLRGWGRGWQLCWTPGQTSQATCLPAGQVFCTPPPAVLPGRWRSSKARLSPQQLWEHLSGRVWRGPRRQLRAEPGPGQGRAWVSRLGLGALGSWCRDLWARQVGRGAQQLGWQRLEAG